MLIVPLCRREKLQAEKYQLQTTEITKKPFAKVSVDLIVSFLSQIVITKIFL